MAGEPFTFSEVDLPAAIRQLRLALGKSTESMAHLLGCSPAGYEKWELGIIAPSAEWLLRMLQLCPDEQTRNAFRIRAERRRKPREKPSGGEGTVNCSALSGPSCRDLAHRAIDTLYTCAQAGDEAAEARLRQFAENLQGAAAYFGDSGSR